MWRELPPTSGLPPRLGDLVGRAADLEPALAAFLAVPSIQLTCSATAGLLVAFEYLKTQSTARTVILPGYTCPLVVMAASQAGLSVQPCDLSPGTFDLDLDLLARLVTTDTLCVVATHWGGALADIQAIRDIVSAVSPDVFLIEDAAQAFGATSRGMPVGLAGDIGVFSFAAGKGLTLFEGGAVVSRSARTAAGLRETAAQLLLPDMKWEVRRTMELAAYTLLYRPLGLYFAHGLPKRYWMSRGEMAKALGDEFSSIALHRVGSWRKSFGARALRRLPEHVAATRERFTRLSARLGAIPGVRVQSPRPGEAPSGTYVLATLADPARADAVLRQGTRLGLGISRLFAFPLDRYGSLAGLLRPADLAISSDMASRSVTVGTSTLMSQAEEDRIVRLFADHATP